MTKNQKQRREYTDGELAGLVQGLEAAWPGAAAQPAQPIDGFGTGAQPRLSEYGVLVAVAFDDFGCDDAFEMVVFNRPQVEAAWALGIEPVAFTRHIISTR